MKFLIWGALIVGLVLGLARATAVRWFRLPIDDPTFEASISPTLRGGDLVLATRITQPVFGDLVVCPDPDYPTEFVIGRIVGEPGDEVEVRDGAPYVNGKKFNTERNCGSFVQVHPDNEAEEVTQTCSWEALANHLHMRGDTAGHKVKPEQFQVDVPEGTFFLLSDNRLFPYDSRNYGPVNIASCKETIALRLISRKGWMDSDNRLNYIQ